MIGPLWITISMGVMVTGLGILYGSLFGSPLHQKLPHLAVGFIIWEFIRNCVTEGTEVFIKNEGLMKQLPSPLSVHIYRLVWRQTQRAPARYCGPGRGGGLDRTARRAPRRRYPHGDRGAG